MTEITKWYRATMRVSPESVNGFDVYVCRLDAEHTLQVDVKCVWGTKWRRDMLKPMLASWIEVTDAAILAQLDRILGDHRR
jgi:hypothetical protein